jgi:hypothetical protein
VWPACELARQTSRGCVVWIRYCVTRFTGSRAWAEFPQPDLAIEFLR